MPTYRSPPGFEHGSPDNIGVLVVNLGTPAAPTPAAVRRFLRQFLSDPRVVEYPRLLWWLILNLVILVIRPSRSAAAYREIWTDKGSPLLLHSRDIVDGLRRRLGGTRDVQVELAMTYGEPDVGSAIDKLLAGGATRILVLPLFPQYSGTTTAAVFDAVTAAVARQRWLPELRFVNSYHDDPAYIRALATSVRDSWAEHGQGETLLMSFHGVPMRTLTSGDPYHCQCQKTARLLAKELELDDDQWMVSFQSRVGREQWLQPYTEQTVKQLAADGVGRLDVICPGFSTDCLETLEEIALQNAGFFRDAGGNELHYIASLNARDDHLDCLQALVERHTENWLPGSTTEARAESRRRALAMGATA